MPNAICNTSPLLYLFRIEAINWLPVLFDKILTATATIPELLEGQERGFEVPIPRNYEWLTVANPKNLPSEWLSQDLGVGELHALALGLENRDFVILLDDLLARRTAKAAGLKVWGTLQILIEAKETKLIDSVRPYIFRLRDTGFWFSDDILQRILKLAKEK